MKICNSYIFPAVIVVAAGCGSGGPPLPQVPQFDEVRAWNNLGTQVTFGPRVAGEVPHQRQLTWMKDRLGYLADTLELQEFTVGSGPAAAKYTNVLARWRPELSDRVLLVAHWDSPAHADRDPDPNRRRHPVPGANDGASGTAVLLELAQLFHDQAPPVGVDLLLTDAGAASADSAGQSLGARHYVGTLGSGPRPRWAVYVDRVADIDLKLPRGANSAPQVLDRVWSIAQRMGRDTTFLAQPGPAVPGDHTVLAAAGIPSAAVVDPEHGPRNVFWRTSSDNMGNTRRESLLQVGEVLATVVYAEAPTP